MSDVWILNASPLILLGKIGRLDLRERLMPQAVVSNTVFLEIQAGIGEHLLKLSDKLSALQDTPGPGSGWKRDGHGEGRRMMLAGTIILYDKCVSVSNVLLQFVKRAALTHHTRDFT